MIIEVTLLLTPYFKGLFRPLSKAEERLLSLTLPDMMHENLH